MAATAQRKQALNTAGPIIIRLQLGPRRRKAGFWQGSDCDHSRFLISKKNRLGRRPATAPVTEEAVHAVPTSGHEGTSLRRRASSASFLRVPRASSHCDSSRRLGPSPPARSLGTFSRKGNYEMDAQAFGHGEIKFKTNAVTHVAVKKSPVVEMAPNFFAFLFFFFARK